MTGITADCTDTPHDGEHCEGVIWLSHLQAQNSNMDFWEALQSVKCVRVFPTGSVLFEQGSEAEGVYVVESGQVRVFLPSAQCRPQLLDIASAGAILGLSETMSGETCRVTAEAGEPTTIGFIPRQKFMAFLEGHSDFCMQVVRILSEDLHSLYHKFRSISAHPGRPRHCEPDVRLN